MGEKPGTLGVIRTRGLLVRNQTLYPLSYEGAHPSVLDYTINPVFFQVKQKTRFFRDATL